MQSFLCRVFLFMYVTTVLGNLFIILNPTMYFLPCNLSFFDICFTYTTVPKMRMNFQAQSKSMSWRDCLTIYISLLLLQWAKFLNYNGTWTICSHLLCEIHSHHEPLALYSFGFGLLHSHVLYPPASYFTDVVTKFLYRQLSPKFLLWRAEVLKVAIYE
jgi:hypothetical protein